jgi:purine-binding chemotaxis protein CheW
MGCIARHLVKRKSFMRSFASFYIDDQLYGIDILLIREINSLLDMSPVAHTPNFIKGLVNLRGQIVTILDLKKRLGQQDTKIGPDTLNIVLKADNELAQIRQQEDNEELTTCADKVGFMVDRIGDVITVEDDSTIELPPANLNDIDGRFLSGVVKMNNQLLAVLNVNHLLADIA